MVTHVQPAEPVFVEQLAALDNRWACNSVPVLQDLRKQGQGAWTVEFLPAWRARRRRHQPVVRRWRRSPDPARTSRRQR
jgi:hypothetical protein